jgi:hypothetical protein
MASRVIAQGGDLLDDVERGQIQPADDAFGDVVAGCISQQLTRLIQQRQGLYDDDPVKSGASQVPGQIAEREAPMQRRERPGEP